MNRSCDAKTCNMSYNQHNMCKPFGPILVCLLPIKYHHSYCCPSFFGFAFHYVEDADVCLYHPPLLTVWSNNNANAHWNHSHGFNHYGELFFSTLRPIRYFMYASSLRQFFFTLETLLFTIILKKCSYNDILRQIPLN